MYSSKGLCHLQRCDLALDSNLSGILSESHNELEITEQQYSCDGLCKTGAPGGRQAKALASQSCLVGLLQGGSFQGRKS